MHAGTKLNLAAGGKPFPREEGWVNMDVIPLPGIDVVHDALAFPWPFPEGAFELVETHHFFEHLPHGGPGQKDWLVAVMEEIHRVLRPDGLLRVVAPHPENRLANLRDPTHTRVIVPENFDYFSPTHPNRFYSHARFRLESTRIRSWEPRAASFLPLGGARLGLTTHLTARAPFLNPLLARPFEAEYELRRLPREDGTI